VSPIVVILLFAELAAVPLLAQQCGDECFAVLSAAGEWAKSEGVKHRGALAGRLFLDLDSPRSNELPDSAIEHRRELFAPVAETLGLPLVRRTRHPALLTCQAAPRGAACQQVLGTGYVALEVPRFISEGEALVRTYVLVLRRSSVGWSTMGCQLHLVRSPDGIWSMDDTRYCVIS